MSDKLKELLIFRTIKLEYPITDGHGKEITELNVRRAKAKDLRRMQGVTNLEKNISLLAMLTGLVPEDLDDLDIADVQQAVQTLEQMQKGKSA